MAVRNAFLCIDGRLDGALSGRLMGDWDMAASAFQDVNAAAMMLEGACDADRSPFPSVRRRHFLEHMDDGGNAPRKDRRDTVQRGRVRLMEKIKEDNMRGDLGSFLVRVQHRQNGSWQGTVTWMEQNRTVHFRSVWELVQLVDEAVRDGAEPEVTWSDGMAAGV